MVEVMGMFFYLSGFLNDVGTVGLDVGDISQMGCHISARITQILEI
jgi:hypothetical protein